MLLPVPGPCASAHALLLDHRAALRAAARHAAAGAQRGARAHRAPLEPRKPARPDARGATQAESLQERWRRRELPVRAIFPTYQSDPDPDPEPRSEAGAAAASQRGEGGAVRDVHLAVHVAPPLAQPALARRRSQCAHRLLRVYALITACASAL